MVRGKRSTTPPTTPKPRKPKKPLAQVQINRASGLNFENEIFHYLTDYITKRDIEGIVYRLPSKKNYDQPIDILVDSKAFGYIGVECKSMDESRLSKEQIKFNVISGQTDEHGHQFKKQHKFLKAGGRYGMVAFKFKKMRQVVFISHQYLLDKIENGETYILLSEVLRIGYNIKSKESLKLYIRNNCRTG